MNPDSETFASRKTRSLEVLVSIWLLFHLICITVAPLGASHLGLKIKDVILPYINFLEISNSWNFFAPEPGPPPMYLDWELLGDNGDVLETGRWPDVKDSYFFRERQNRRITLSRFMLSDSSRIEEMLVPFLCKENIKASAVRAWLSVTSINVEMKIFGHKPAQSGVSTDKKFLLHSFCER